jgi:DNA invertase Pin-like site-specific DNA recombinase
MTTTTAKPRSRRRPHRPRPAVAIVYSRVSTAQQAASGLSLDSQQAATVAAAEAAGYRVVEVADQGISGGRGVRRPGLARALDMLAKGEAAALYVSKVDRLSRSTIDALVIAEAADAQGWRLVALDLALDTSTPVGRLVLSVLAAAAEMERERIGERHRDWHAAQAARGTRWGVDAGPRSALPGEVRQRILDARAAGESYRSIAAALNADEVPTATGQGRWWPSNVRAHVHSPASEALAG